MIRNTYVASSHTADQPTALIDSHLLHYPDLCIADNFSNSILEDFRNAPVIYSLSLPQGWFEGVFFITFIRLHNGP